jgi:nucleotide-binding universal stress UspA family protein
VTRVLLASEGRPIPPAAVEFAARLASPAQAEVHVFSIARVHGVAFGMQTPGLMPTKREWEQQRDIVAAAVRRLRKKGLAASGRVLGTRKPTRRICGEAEKLGCDAIVMAADPPRNRLIADMLWSQEPYRVRRRAKLPVYLVTDED